MDERWTQRQRWTPRHGGLEGRATDRGRPASREGEELFAPERPPRAFRHRTPYELDRDYVEGNLGAERPPPYGWGPMQRSTRHSPNAMPPWRGWEGPGSARSGREGDAVVFAPEEDGPRPLVGAFRGVGPRGYRRSDERILEDVCETLTEHPQLDCSAVEVAVDDADVVLTGELPSLRLKRLCEDVAYDVRGVDDVFNRIRVARD